jgi:hypothetical protein
MAFLEGYVVTSWHVALQCLAGYILSSSKLLIHRLINKLIGLGGIIEQTEGETAFSELPVELIAAIAIAVRIRGMDPEIVDAGDLFHKALMLLVLRACK